MIRRETSADLVNSITNMPEVLPFISRHGGQIDWSPLIEHPDGMILSNGEDACMVLERTAPRDWQVSTIFAPTCRGARAVETGLAMKDFMLPEHADMIFGSIPTSFRHALWFYRRLGGVEIPVIESGGEPYVAQDGEALFAFRSDA